MKKLLTITIIIFLLGLLINYNKEIRILWYDLKDIPEFTMNSQYSIIKTKDDYYYLKFELRHLNYETYYCYFHYGKIRFYSIEISKPRKLVSEKQAKYIYYKGVYKPQMKVKKINENIEL